MLSAIDLLDFPSCYTLIVQASIACISCIGSLNLCPCISSLIMFADFGGLSSAEPETKKQRMESGEQRQWLRVYETLPPQMLNAYGIGRYVTMSDKEVWEQLVKPLKTGAAYMTEYASMDDERRGVAVNRWLLAVYTFLQYQSKEHVKKQNEYVMKESICKELYQEIMTIMPSIEYCLAPKKVSEKIGAAALRSSVVQTGMESHKTSAELEKHAKLLYDWVKAPASKIRMMMTYQGAGGGPFVASVHHRATQCFVSFGNEHHTKAGDSVSLKEWQEAIVTRHQLGSAGISDNGDGVSFDFK